MAAAPVEGPAGDSEPTPDVTAARYQALIRNSTELVAVIDPETHVHYANPAALHLMHADQELPNGVMINLVHPDDRPRVEEHLAELLEQPWSSRVDTFRMRGPDGDWRTIEALTCNLSDEPAVRGLVVNGRDITRRTDLEGAIAILTHGNRVLVHATSEQQLLDDMCRAIVQTAGYPVAWVGYARHDSARTITPMANSGLTDAIHQFAFTWADEPAGQGPTGTAIRTGRTQVLIDTHSAPPESPWRQAAEAQGLRTSCVMPLFLGPEILGALCIYSTRPGAFDVPSVQVLQQLADDLSYGIARLRDLDALNNNLRTTIEAVAAAAELHDPYTAGHQRRVAQLARAIATEMQLDDDTVTGLAIGATVHDIGKVGVPVEILTKATRLLPEEYQLIKLHPGSGHDILAGIDGSRWPVAQMVHQHHERYDGLGYPRGLSGDEILPEARIIAVADTFEAMSQHRPYRAGRGTDEAIIELRDGAGKHYDPDAVDALLDVIARNDFAF